jgi:hypothetical protein
MPSSPFVSFCGFRSASNPHLAFDRSSSLAFRVVLFIFLTSSMLSHILRYPFLSFVRAAFPFPVWFRSMVSPLFGACIEFI